MTIGIAARGDRAGYAVLQGLLAAELIGRGEVGGFCTFAWCDGAGQFHHAVTQRGGTSGLPPLPQGWAEARLAALISSGPDRAEPLTQFLPCATGIGLVTGHRLPTSKLPSGEVLNEAALQAMAGSGFSQKGLEDLLSAPGMDAGLICLPLTGPCLMANAPRVSARNDQGAWLYQDQTQVVAVMHNSILTARHQGDGLAQLVGDVVRGAMEGAPRLYQIARLPDHITVTKGADEALHLDASGVVCLLQSANPAYQGPARAGITAIYTGTPVYQQGRLIGHAASEAFAGLADGGLTARAGDAARSFVVSSVDLPRPPSAP